MTELIDATASSANAWATSLDANEDTARSSQPVWARMPLSIPRDQLYFWSPAWQLGEAAADEAIAKGDLVKFDDWIEAARWLLAPDDD